MLKIAAPLLAALLLAVVIASGVRSVTPAPHSVPLAQAIDTPAPADPSITHAAERVRIAVAALERTEREREWALDELVRHKMPPGPFDVFRSVPPPPWPDGGRPRRAQSPRSGGWITSVRWDGPAEPLK